MTTGQGKNILDPDSKPTSGSKQKGKGDIQYVKKITHFFSWSYTQEYSVELSDLLQMKGDQPAPNISL